MSTAAAVRKAKKPPSLKVCSEVVITENKSQERLLEVIPNIFISGYEAAKNWELLSSSKITHILNLAGENKCPNLFPGHYTYLSLKMPDNPKVDILFFLYFSMEFIAESVKNNGKVLVHCVKGTSRAAAVILAYLIANGCSEQEAYSCLLKSQPTIDPNFGFVCQLKEWGVERREIRRFMYNERFNMFVNSDSESDLKCRIHITGTQCFVYLVDCSLDEVNFALACGRVWELFNRSKAEIVYI